DHRPERRQGDSGRRRDRRPVCQEVIRLADHARINSRQAHPQPWVGLFLSPGASPMTPTNPDRRAFLAASPVAATGLPAGRAATADHLRVTLGVQRYALRHVDLEPALKRMKELGLKYCEFYSKHIPPNSSENALKEIMKLCKEYDVTPVGFGVSGFSKNHDANKKLFDLGKALGLKYLSADPD